MENKFTMDLREITLEDLNIVGGKNASLGEMLQHLAQLGITIPGGFAITVDAYWAFLQHNQLEASIYRIIGEIDMNNLISLRKGGTLIRQLIRNGKFPRDLQEEIVRRYRELSK